MTKNLQVFSPTSYLYSIPTQPRMIIGITGTNGAGKESVAHFLKNSGFVQFSCSDAIRDEARKRDLSLDRDVLISLGNELRAAYGPSVLANRVYSIIKAQNVKDAIVVSIRNPAEAEALSQRDDFVLVWVDALPAVRFERSRRRMRDKADLLSFEEFMSMEMSERDAGPTGQRLDFMKNLASIHIENNGTIEELEKEVYTLMSSVKKG